MRFSMKKNEKIIENYWLVHQISGFNLCFSLIFLAFVAKLAKRKQNLFILNIHPWLEANQDILFKNFLLVFRYSYFVRFQKFSCNRQVSEHQPPNFLYFIFKNWLLMFAHAPGCLKWLVMMCLEFVCVKPVSRVLDFWVVAPPHNLKVSPLLNS